VIVTVTTNAALDVTYEVDELIAHGSHRVRSVRVRAGGNGVNVASVLIRMRRQVIATGLVGGAAGNEIRADLDARGVEHRFVDCEGTWSAAAVLQSVAGEIDPDDVARLAARVQTEETDDTRPA
jgi:tagatose 6-phosphate kinase